MPLAWWNGIGSGNKGLPRGYLWGRVSTEKLIPFREVSSHPGEDLEERESRLGKGVTAQPGSFRTSFLGCGWVARNHPAGGIQAKQKGVHTYQEKMKAVFF